jgi:hypothetical protein
MAEGKKGDFSYFFELYEYLLLKHYFIVPFFPVFKPSTLRKDFPFNVYLKFCLLDKLRLFFKISWTCWIASIILIFFWSVVIATSTVSVSVNKILYRLS